ncbi:MAG TPA: DNA repair protein RadA [Candidatus Xenobia bacterium]|jgi:DNA repair protein RadA/Sms
MKGAKTRFVCQECGAVAIKWQGRCHDCGQWNSLVEEPVTLERKGLSGPLLQAGALTPLSEVSIESSLRSGTGVPEFDRVLGGGLVEGSLVLVGGPPGTGKSTLMLQVAEGVAKRQPRPVLYVTGEESAQQTRLRADRLGLRQEGILLLPEVNVDVIVEHVQRLKPALVLIDSIQTLFRPEIGAAPGSVSQVRESAATLMRLAKSLPVTVLLVGHVTKDGSLAGPRVLEHLVDTVLYFEGEGLFNYRVLKAVKNRFGPSSEVGIFEMDGTGLRGKPNASELFLAYRQSDVPGSCVVPIMEGTRACLVEVQALVSTTTYPMPTRRSNGVDHNRTAVLLAVLERRARVHVTGHDVFVNVVGGLRVDEPALDLGILLAVASGISDVAVERNTACLGEVGLGGELRGVDQLDKRLSECAQAGFTRCLVPARNVQPTLQLPKQLELLPVATLSDALEAALPVRTAVRR